MTGELQPIVPGDPRGRWSHDGEGNGSIWAQAGDPAIIGAGLQLVRDQLVGDEPSLLVEDDYGRQAVLALYPVVPSDELLDEVPAAFASLPVGRGSWEMTPLEDKWRARRMDSSLGR